MQTHKFAGEVTARDEIAVMPGLLPPVVVQEVRETSDPNYVRIVLATDTANPDDAFEWPRNTVFTVTYDSSGARLPDL